MKDIYLIIFYLFMTGPSLLIVKETKTRLSNLKSGVKGLFFLPLTVGALMTYVIFGKDFLSQIPILNISWLGYNIALGPFGNHGVFGILPFIPMLVYMLIHVNYFEEFYFRKNVKGALMHVAMGVAVYVALVLLPLGFFYRRIFNKYGINHVYTLHFATNLVLIGISISSYFLIPVRAIS